jgi:ribosomal protein S18 acetylase RimI-like enzyme
MSDDRAKPSESRPIRLRPMICADVAQCVPLLAQLGYEMSVEEAAQRVRDVSSTSDHSLLVAEIDRRVAGLLHVFVRPAIENPREAVVQALVVDRAYRRAGVGRTLMAEAERWGSARSCRSVVLSSNITRTRAHAFYNALGYRVAATACIFRKPLSLEPEPSVAVPGRQLPGSTIAATRDGTL